MFENNFSSDLFEVNCITLLTLLDVIIPSLRMSVKAQIKKINSIFFF